MNSMAIIMGQVARRIRHDIRPPLYILGALVLYDVDGACLEPPPERPQLKLTPAIFRP